MPEPSSAVQLTWYLFTSSASIEQFWMGQVWNATTSFQIDDCQEVPFELRPRTGGITVDMANDATGNDQLDKIPVHETISSSQETITTIEGSMATPDSTLSASTTLGILDFRQSLDRIPIDDHELPVQFRPLSKIRGKRKKMLSKADRETVEKIWSDYLILSTSRQDAKDQFTRREYARLMYIIRHSSNPEKAARRILVLQRDFNKDGIIATRKMKEVVAQAHIILGSIPESIRIYHEVVGVVGPGSLEHRMTLWTMVDGFAANRLENKGIAFLDGLPSYIFPEKALDFHPFYQRLLSPYVKNKENCLGSEQSREAIRQFVTQPFLPGVRDLVRTLKVVELDPDRINLVHKFSKTVSGLLIRIGNVETLTLLMQCLLRLSHVQEAVRVLDMTLDHGMKPELDRIRLYLLHSLDTSEDRDRCADVIQQWDTLACQRTSLPDNADRHIRHQSGLVKPGLHCQSMQDPMSKKYSKLVIKCIKDNEISAALDVAKYMSVRGWNISGIDFKQLNSHMVNHGQSESYADYLQVRYTLGSSSEPDLHTFRRLVYAACRRSDLFSALTLFKLVRTQHPEWTLDTTFYNSIISAAAATGHIKVAERTFVCLLEDGVKPDIVSFHGLLNAYGNVKDLEAALLIPEKMVKHKLSPTTKTFNLVMKAYVGTRLDLATSRKLFQAMQHSGEAVPPDLTTFNQLLEGYHRTGNQTWFNDYFDRYFDQRDSTETSPAIATDTTGDANDVSTTRKSQAKNAFKRPEKTDDKTLLVQLKQSLLLSNIDLSIVWELWHAIEHKFGPVFSTDSSDTDAAKRFVINYHLESEVPDTHVPFKKQLGQAWMPATDGDRFRLKTLNLFRSAFRARGDTNGVKRMDKVLTDLFPDHPQSQAILQKKVVKKYRRPYNQRPSNGGDNRAK
ncbi:hypothetical protein BG011_006910 [Mortierella polycephala]|uniref:Pentatricopeptide repeat-containing protein n=1 Tax=Mortierella polycephala TaxID=41804 RepID=A0A9P6TYY4_9FUNG|nr:hypothetical protein BG011_006910 [Mortierella polycephala]